MIKDEETLKNLCLVTNSYLKQDHFEFIKENIETNVCNDQMRKDIFYSTVFKVRSMRVQRMDEYDENYYNKMKMKKKLENF